MHYEFNFLLRVNFLGIILYLLMLTRVVALLQRLAVLEDICKRKDSAIYELKQEIIALESKVYFSSQNENLFGFCYATNSLRDANVLFVVIAIVFLSRNSHNHLS